jgi:hypothetical protein
VVLFAAAVAGQALLGTEGIRGGEGEEAKRAFQPSLPVSYFKTIEKLRFAIRKSRIIFTGLFFPG